jgi:hypothetical protein
MWLDGAPEVWPLAIVGAPFVIGLGLWLARRRLFAVGGWLLAGVLTSAYILNVYIPAASEHWSQRTAIAAYFAQRGPEDRLLSWWFYYRGETYFTKGDVWVMQEPDRKELADYIESREGQGSTLWFITIESHAARLPGHLPTKYRGGVEEVYRNAHYVLLRLPVE